MATKRGKTRRGGALLVVLWLTAALSAIAFSVANTVRGETERTAVGVESLKTYYLATGAIERAMLYMEWGQMAVEPDGTSRFYRPGMPYLDFTFPTGQARVEIIPESSKLNLNMATPEDLYRLLLALGADPGRAHTITAAIEDWRTPRSAEGPPGPFDGHYLGLGPSFRPRHASFEEIEEVLLLPGMTPELFYGGCERAAEGGLVPRSGLRDCITVFPGGGMIDVNTADPAVLAAFGVPPELTAAIVARRTTMPFRSYEEVREAIAGVQGAERLGLGGGSAYTFRATARLRRADGSLSPDRRSVAALVKYLQAPAPEPYNVLRWYDNVWVR